jgi:hypothetical protein
MRMLYNISVLKTHTFELNIRVKHIPGLSILTEWKMQNKCRSTYLKEDSEEMDSSGGTCIGQRTYTMTTK